jgi:hypothetical protein
MGFWGLLILRAFLNEVAELDGGPRRFRTGIGAGRSARDRERYEFIATQVIVRASKGAMERFEGLRRAPFKPATP